MWYQLLIGLLLSFISFEIYLRLCPSDNIFEILYKFKTITEGKEIEVEQDIANAKSFYSKIVIAKIKNSFTDLMIKCNEEHGIDIERLNCSPGETALSYAIGIIENDDDINNIDIIKTLLDYGFKNNNLIDISDYHDQTPLMVASYLGLDKIIQLLLERGASIDNLNNKNATSLMAASQFGHLKSVQVLLEYNANVLITNFRSNALIDASKGGHCDIVKELIHHVIKKNDISLADFINSSNKVGSTSLHYSCMGGYVDIVRILLENGANINQKTNRNTAQVNALMGACQAGKVEVVKMLLQYSILLDDTDVNGNTALKYASHAGHVAVVEELLKAAMNINNNDNDNRDNDKNNNNNFLKNYIIMASSDGKTPLDVAKTDEIKNILLKHLQD